MDLFDVFIFIHSLVSSFIASLIGCKTPFMFALLGPFRLWLIAIILRSARVKKATVAMTIAVSIIVSVILFKKGFRPFAFALDLFLRQVLLL